MSVIVSAPGEIGAIAKSLIYKNARHGAPGEFWKFHTHQEELELKDLHKDACAVQEEIDLDIACWLDRLYIANQLAFAYTYNDGRNTICRLEKSHIDAATPLPTKELLSRLKSLRYNLYSNSGHSFVSQKDAERLDKIIVALMEEMLRDEEA